MIETSYTKLFSSIVTSTIWREDDKTRILWITMLALKNRHGQVNGSVPGLAALANIATEDCRAALIRLASPDLDSRTKEFEGRRITVIDGGWQILNHAKYRNAMSEDERREYQRLWQQKKRKPKVVDSSVDMSKSTLTHAEAEADADTDTKGNYCFLLKESIRTPKMTEAWLKWIEHRKKFKSKDWCSLFHRHAEFLNRYDEPNAFHILDISLRNGWQGLFEPKNYANGQHQNTGKVNTRNVGTYKTTTDFAAAVKRKMEQQALAAQDGEQSNTQGT